MIDFIRSTDYLLGPMRPLIAIVGRPNVGKSTLFNRLVGRRQALVHDQPGVTRDRLYATCDVEGRECLVVDTGGIGNEENQLARQVTAQSLEAVREADLILCLFDGRVGAHPLDTEIVEILRRHNTPIIYVANKMEARGTVDDLHRLGIDAPVEISAEHGLGMDDLRTAMQRVMPPPHPTCPSDTSPSPNGEREEAELNIAIIGRPNVGKSTLVNTFAGSHRVVAHDMPGTTRDVIDVMIEKDGRRLRFLDTAGIRRKSKTDSALEKFSILKALRAMERADLILCLVDVRDGITHQDRQLCAEAIACGKPTILVVNKWDLALRTTQCAVRDRSRQLGALRHTYEKGFRSVLGEHRNIPMVFLSALEGTGLNHLRKAMWQFGAAMRRRLTTSELNRIIASLQARHHLPSSRGRPVKLYYATQVGIAPPCIVCFSNQPDAIPTSYRRYMLRQLEGAFDAPGLPIRLSFRAK